MLGRSPLVVLPNRTFRDWYYPGAHWRRSVIKLGGGEVGVSLLRPSNCFTRVEKLVLPSIFDTSHSSYMMWILPSYQSYPTTVSNERMWHFRGIKTYSDPSYIFSEGQDLPNAQDYAAAGAGFLTGRISFLSSGQRYQSAVELGMCSAGTNWAVAILWVPLLIENFRCGWFQRFCHGFLFSHKGTGKVQNVLVLQCGMRGLIARRKYRRMKAEVNDNTLI